MALDLYANYERTSNSPVFYRTTSVALYSFFLRLSDAAFLNENYNGKLYATKTVNGVTSEFVKNVTTGIFEDFLAFSCQTPRICSISVSVSSLPGSLLLASFDLTAKFLTTIPRADFIGFGESKIYFDPILGPQKLVIDTSNFAQSSGTRFYGEGHTETFYLCCNDNTASLSSLWFVGNPLGEINSPYKPTSFVPTLTAPLKNSVKVSIPTVPFDNSEYPLSLMYLNSDIDASSPIFTYKDDGTKDVYPYFTTTVDIQTLQRKSTNTYLKDHIIVLSYPEPASDVLISPFVPSIFNLPVNSDNRTFLANLSVLPSTTVNKETFIGTVWSIGADSSVGEWGGLADSFTTTTLLTSVTSYQFELGYDNIKNSILDYFKASLVVSTTATLNVSSYKDIVIDLAPYDWIKRTTTQVSQTTALVNPLPYVKIFTPNYFNEKNTPVHFEFVENDASPYFTLKYLRITSNKSSSSIELTTSTLPITASMVFDKIGLVKLNAVAIVQHKITGEESRFSVELDKMIEIVEQYDVVDSTSYHSELSKLEYPYVEEPLMSPNEWVTADNVNSVLKKLQETVYAIDGYTKLYTKKFCLYGWNATTFETNNSIYTWADLECPSNFKTITWTDFECISADTSKAWQGHECGDELNSGSCFGKYCEVEWNWKSRTCDAQDYILKWKDVECDARFAKKWKFEICKDELDFVNCPRSYWRIANIDPQDFPFSRCSVLSRCRLVDVNYHEQSNTIITAYATEIQVAENDYNMTRVTRKGRLDDLMPFKKIVALDVNDAGEIFVLDSTLSKVAVLHYEQNKLKTFTSWGRFGYRYDPLGLNKPQDLHVDAKNTVWIADTGNKVVKKFSFNGKNLGVVFYEEFGNTPPLSVCVDSVDNVHVLLSNKVVVFNYKGEFQFEYIFSTKITQPRKINTGYKRETIYITHDDGIVKYFRNGSIAHYIAHKHQCTPGNYLTGFTSLKQDKYRNLFVTVNDKLLKIPDLMNLQQIKAELSASLFWSLDKVSIDEEEYIQPWVYIRSFQRMWDNIELLRGSLFYEEEGCKKATSPIYSKSDLVIGQNEIVSNAVINRLSSQLWANLETMFRYFDPSCDQIVSSLDVNMSQCTCSFVTLTNVPEITWEPPTVTPTPTPTEACWKQTITLPPSPLSDNVCPNNLITNGDFVNSTPKVVGGVASGWMLSGVDVHDISLYGIINQPKNVFIDLMSVSPGFIRQTVPVENGFTYQLSFDLGADKSNLSDNASNRTMIVELNNETHTFTVTPTSVALTYDSFNWQRHSIDYTATSNTLTISFSGYSSGAQNYGPVLDNICVVRIPPSNCSLYGLITFDGAQIKNLNEYGPATDANVYPFGIYPCEITPTPTLTPTNTITPTPTLTPTSTFTAAPVIDPILPEVNPEEIDYSSVSSASQGTRTKTLKDMYDRYGGMSNVSWISMCGGTGYGTSTGTVALKFGPSYTHTVSGNGKGAALTIYNMYTMGGRLYGTVYKGTAGAQGTFNSTTDARAAIPKSLAAAAVAINVDITDLPCTISASKGAASNPKNVGTAVAFMRIRTKDKSKY